MADKKRSRSKADKAIEPSADLAATDATETTNPESAPEPEQQAVTPDTPDMASEADAPKGPDEPKADAASPAAEPEGDPDTAQPGQDPDTQPDPETAESETTDTTDTTDQPPAEIPEDAEDHREPSETSNEHIPANSRPEQVIVRKGGFFAMLLGGVAAAAIGFGMARYVLPQDFPFPASGSDSVAIDDLTQKIDSQTQDMSRLSSGMDVLEDGSDSGGLAAEMDSLSAAIDTVSGRVDDIATRLDAFEARLSGVETGTPGDGGSQAALSAYEQELQALQASIAQQKSEIEAIADAARAKEQSAVETAQATMRRAALTRIQTALDAGTSFDAALADLEAAGVSVPEALASAAAEGVATQAELSESFPDAARRALAVSRAAVDDAGAGGLGGFLRSQLGARSLEPREGDDPDAVLSRAEAAVREGRLNDALAEIETLPEVGRAELSDWSAKAAGRLDALAATEALTQDIN